MADNREDDGYRGWLRNPRNGRVMRANKFTVIRGDLDRISGPNEIEPTVSVGIKASQSEPAQSAPQQPAVTSTPVEVPSVDQSEVSDALNEILLKSRKTTDRDALKSLGASIGLKLTANMNEKTMRDRIERQIEKIQAAGE